MNHCIILHTVCSFDRWTCNWRRRFTMNILHVNDSASEQVHSSVSSLYSIPEKEVLYCVYSCISCTTWLQSCSITPEQAFAAVWAFELSEFVAEGMRAKSPERLLFFPKNSLKDADKLSGIKDKLQQVTCSIKVQTSPFEIMKCCEFDVLCLCDISNKKRILALHILESELSTWKKESLISQITWHQLTYLSIKPQSMKPSCINPKSYEIQGT